MAADLAPAPEYGPGDLVDLGERCPPRCVTWSADGTCWALTRLRRKSARPEMAVYQVVGPVDDPDAYLDGPPPELEPAGARTPPPPPRPPAPPATDPATPDPVDRVRAVFGPGVTVVSDPGTLTRLVERLLDSQERRDNTVLAGVEWSRLAAAVAATDPGELVGAARAVIGWCETADPDRLKLGGWKLLVAQVEAAEGHNPAPEVRLMPWKPPPEATG